MLSSVQWFNKVFNFKIYLGSSAGRVSSQHGDRDKWKIMALICGSLQKCHVIVELLSDSN